MTYRNEKTRLSEAAPQLVESSSAAEALYAWMDLFLDYLATKRGMADAFPAVLVTDGDLRMQTRDRLAPAIATLLTAGQADQTIRPDVDPNDVLMALGGVSIIAGQPSQRDLAGRLPDLLIDGLKYWGNPDCTCGTEVQLPDHGHRPPTHGHRLR